MRRRTALVLVVTLLALGGGGLCVPVRLALPLTEVASEREQDWYVFPTLQPCWVWDVNRLGEPRMQTYGGDRAERRVCWPALFATHGILLLVGGGLLTWVVRNNRRRRAEEAA